MLHQNVIYYFTRPSLTLQYLLRLWNTT